MTDDELLAEARSILVLFALIRPKGATPIYDILIARHYGTGRQRNGENELTVDGQLLHSLIFAYRHGRTPITQEALDATRSEITRRTIAR